MSLTEATRAMSGAPDAAASLAALEASNWLNAAGFLTVGIFMGGGTFLSGSLLGKTGERLTMRLRSAIFEVQPLARVGEHRDQSKSVNLELAAPRWLFLRCK